MSTLSETIAAFRREANETQAALAEALGVSNRTVSKWENAESEPEAAYLIALADHFGIAVDALLGHAPKDRDPYEGIETYNEAAKKFFEESRAALDRVQSCYDRIFKGGLGKDAEESKKASGYDDPQAPVFPFSENGVPWPDSDAVTSLIHFPPLYTALTAGREVNVAVSLFPNENNSAWLENRADELADALRAFADPRALRLLHKMYAADFPEEFTLEYAAEIAGMPAEELEPLLNRLAEEPEEVELTEGTAKLYRYWCGNGRVLAALSLFYLEFVARETTTNAYNGTYHPYVKKEDNA